jgi:hypothetical protein
MEMAAQAVAKQKCFGSAMAALQLVQISALRLSKRLDYLIALNLQACFKVLVKTLSQQISLR